MKMQNDSEESEENAYLVIFYKTDVSLSENFYYKNP